MWTSFPFLVFSLCLFLRSANAALANLTIDDSDLTYFTFTEDASVEPAPTRPWAAISPTTPCVYCSAQPPTADIYDQTWHDGTNNSAGSFTFQGSAVYIYGIDLANPANISFALDNATAPYHYYAGSEQFVFKSLFFSATNLTPANVNHTVSWVLHATATNGTTGLIDYAVITVDESTVAPSGTTSPSSTALPSASTKAKSKTAPIVGGVVGGLALIAALGVAVFLLRKRNSRRSTSQGETPRTGAARGRLTDVQPFMAQGSAGSEIPPSANEKTLDAAWINPSLPMASDGPQSTTDVSSTALPSSLSVAPTDPPSRPLTAPLSVGSTATSVTASARERELEQRLAQLEAQVQQHITLPPPYVQPPSPSS
ncbi:hypothetical protein DFH06DRAFT_1169444 [Mycena polygramma]|nr:hypothetical protein DFH06DRAFT_1169444 [Mycena polygramma]